MRLIDADALKENMRGEFIDSVEERIAIREIDNAPTIEPKRGEWIYHELCVADESKLLQDLYSKMIQKTDSCLTTHQLVHWGDVKDVIEEFFINKRLCSPCIHLGDAQICGRCRNRNLFCADMRGKDDE